MKLESIIVCGPRDGTSAHVVLAGMSTIPVSFNHVVVGSMNGTDFQVHYWCIEHEILVSVDPARWTTGEKKGRPEGPIRNLRMYVTFEPLAVFGFRSDGPGTNGMLEISMSGGTPTYLYDPAKSRWVEI